MSARKKVVAVSIGAALQHSLHCTSREVLDETIPIFRRGQNDMFSRRSTRPSFASNFPSLMEGAGKTGWPLAPGAPAQKEFARAR
jgi:hypothetical protein